MELDASAYRFPVDTSELLRPEDLGIGPLFWTARDAVIILGIRDKRIMFWNPVAEQLYGYTPEEAVGQSFDMLVPERMKSHVATLADALSLTDHGEIPDPGAPIEFPALHKSGQEIFVEFSVSSWKVAGDHYAYVLVRDCTERKRLEAERDALLATAQETVRRASELASLKADFTSMVAHEVGSPLAAISALIDLLDRDDLPPSKRTELLATMRSEAHLLQRLVGDVQSATSMERGDFSVRLEPIPVEEILNAATAAARVQLSDHDFRVAPAPDTHVLADSERVGQVLRNLLGNAAKYTPAGTLITLQARQEDGCVCIDVIDEGPGIEPEDLQHIFSKFGRGRDVTGKRLPGMGLGLYVSRQIVQAHGGELAAHSAPGRNTTFSFCLKKAS